MRWDEVLRHCSQSRTELPENFLYLGAWNLVRKSRYITDCVECNTVIDGSNPAAAGYLLVCLRNELLPSRQK